MSNEITPVKVNPYAEIKTLFDGFKVDGVTVAVAMLYYQGHGEPYIVYTQYDTDNSYSADNEIEGYIVYFDFDIYSKCNYLAIVEAVKAKMKSIGWTWQVSRDSPAMYEVDTGYFHKTLCFARPIQEVEIEAQTQK